MLPKRCSHCHKIFTPNPTGLSTVFCEPCVRLCEEAYTKVLRFQGNTKLSMNDMIMKLKIPRAFVYQLFALGRFSEDLSTRNISESSKTCVICHHALAPSEDVYCATCNTVVQKRMHVEFNQVSASEPIAKALGAKNNEQRRSLREHHYGLGRSFQ